MSFILRLFICVNILILPITHKVMGQVFNDTLAGVNVLGNKIVKANDLKSTLHIGQYIDSIPSLTLKQYQNLSLATLLSQQTPIFVKSYGINNLATLSFRGASAAQSMVLWKGVPINNPALGMADVSLIQTGMFNKVSLQYGGNAAMLGSGNVGGALILDEQYDFYTPSQYSIGLGVGSFGRKDANIKMDWNHKKWHFGIKGFYQTMLNNFKYKDVNNVEQITQNARLKAFGGIANARYTINDNQYLSLDVWYQDYKREIPKAQFENLSTKFQKDKALRSLLQWSNQSRFGHWFAKVSFNKDELDYSDSFYNIYNQNQTYQFYQELSWKKSISLKETKAEHTFFVNIPFQYSWMNLQNGNSPHQSKPAMSGAYQYLHGNKKLGAQFNFRQEWLNGDANPFLPGMGLQYLLINKNQWQLSLKGTIQRTYRVPTLNELYNFPGGNEHLKPEQGWNKELAYDFNWKSKKQSFAIKHQANYFNRKIQDWIYWLGGSIWTPHNLAKVYNRGLETHTSLNLDINKDWQIHTALKTAYVLSTTLASYMPNDNSIGKQIPYAPRYSGNINFGFTYKSLFVNYNHAYTGYRFVTTDESIFLLPYHNGNVQIMYPFKIKGLDLQSAIQVQNIWNTQYEVIAHRPMPKRFMTLSLQMTF